MGWVLLSFTTVAVLAGPAVAPASTDIRQLTDVSHCRRDEAFPGPKRAKQGTVRRGESADGVFAGARPAASGCVRMVILPVFLSGGV